MPVTSCRVFTVKPHNEKTEMRNTVIPGRVNSRALTAVSLFHRITPLDVHCLQP